MANYTADDITDMALIPGEKKKKVMRFIAEAHHSILLAFIEKPDVMDLSLGDQIHNILCTCYNTLRQRFNPTKGTQEAKIADTDFKITVNGSDITRQRGPILQIVEDTATTMGIPFEKYSKNDPKNWYSIANLLLKFLLGFALRRREIRLGRHYMSVEKSGNQEKDVELSQYGIYEVHHSLCEGTSFPPEIRAFMPEAVGPLTALLCYIRAEKPYSLKWSAAVSSAFDYFPRIGNIMRLVKDKDPSELSELISLLADIALMIINRQATRMFPPPAAFSFIFKRDHTIGESLYKADTLLESFNFSGHGAFAFYKIMMSYKWKLQLNKGTDSLAKQVCYHSMFGTCKEDLGILSQITNQESWDTREKMGEILTEVNTEGTLIEFTPILQRYYSKVSRANRKSLFPILNFNCQISSVPCFEGRTKRTFTYAFWEYFNRGEIEKLDSMASIYIALKREVSEKAESRGMGTLDADTTKWYGVDDVTPSTDGTEEPSLQSTLFCVNPKTT